MTNVGIWAPKVQLISALAEIEKGRSVRIMAEDGVGYEVVSSLGSDSLTESEIRQHLREREAAAAALGYEVVSSLGPVGRKPKLGQPDTRVGQVWILTERGEPFRTYEAEAEAEASLDAIGEAAVHRESEQPDHVVDAIRAARGEGPETEAEREERYRENLDRVPW